MVSDVLCCSSQVNSNIINNTVTLYFIYIQQLHDLYTFTAASNTRTYGSTTLYLHTYKTTVKGNIITERLRVLRWSRLYGRVRQLVQSWIRLDIFVRQTNNTHLQHKTETYIEPEELVNIAFSGSGTAVLAVILSRCLPIAANTLCPTAVHSDCHSQHHQIHGTLTDTSQ